MSRRVESFILSPGSIKITLRATLIKTFALSLPSPTAHGSRLTPQLLVYRATQFRRFDGAEILEYYFAVLVVKISCRQSAVPGRIDRMNGRFGIFDVEQNYVHPRVHRLEELRHLSLDIAHFVERHRDKVQALVAIVIVDLHQIRKFFAAPIAPGGPEINQQWPGVFRVASQDLFEPF